MLGSADSMRAMLSMSYKAVTRMYSLQQHAEGKDVADEELCQMRSRGEREMPQPTTLGDGMFCASMFSN